MIEEKEIPASKFSNFREDILIENHSSTPKMSGLLFIYDKEFKMYFDAVSALQDMTNLNGYFIGIAYNANRRKKSTIREI